MALKDLLSAGLPQTFNLPKMQYLRTAIVRYACIPFNFSASTA